MELPSTAVDSQMTLDVPAHSSITMTVPSWPQQPVDLSPLIGVVAIIAVAAVACFWIWRYWRWAQFASETAQLMIEKGTDPVFAARAAWGIDTCSTEQVLRGKERADG